MESPVVHTIPKQSNAPIEFPRIPTKGLVFIIPAETIDLGNALLILKSIPATSCPICCQSKRSEGG